MKKIVGRISFFGMDGNVSEVVEYSSKESYLEAIKKELNSNCDGFRYETLIENPNVRKLADDCVYNAYGVDNPRTLEWYENKERG